MEYNIKMQLLFMHYWLCWRAELQKSIFILLLLPIQQQVHITYHKILKQKYDDDEEEEDEEKTVYYLYDTNVNKMKSCLFNSFSYLSRQ